MARAAVALGLTLAACAAWAQAYQFDLSELDERLLEVTGYIEGKAEQLRLRPQAALYPLGYDPAAPRTRLERLTPALDLSLRYRGQGWQAYAHTAGAWPQDAVSTPAQTAWLEAGVRLSPSHELTVDLGKQVQRWGKGYAWNPVAFFERPKDATDPQQSREGYAMLSVDWVRSLPGPVTTLGLTGVVLPARGDWNRDYGAPGHDNVGVKLYTLVDDTDIDLIWASQGSRPQRVGLDFSRNLGSNLEIHGEWARQRDVTQLHLAADGSITSQRGDVDSWLIGLRYLTERDVTWIVELYRNGLGRDADERARFDDLMAQAFGPQGSPVLRQQALTLARGGLASPYAGRRYAYVRVSAKDPFDWLYVTPALTLIVNLEDHSRQWIPELTWNGWTNTELRVRATFSQGGTRTEFGAKPVARRWELLLRRYF